MAAMADGTEHDLHGAQVGVASILCGALWQIALDDIGIGTLDPAALTPPDDLRDRVLGSWIDLDPTGQLGAECWLVVQQKYDVWAGNQEAAQQFFAHWPIHEAQLRRYAQSPEVPAQALANWGAPRAFSELTPPVDSSRARWALRTLPFMRDRFALADLLLLAGTWNDQLFDRVLDRARESGGGL